MVVTVSRLEAGDCTAVSYDSHAWWGSRERPMSDVTSLIPCAQPQAPGPALSCSVVSSQVLSNTYPTHRATRAMGGVAWSGVVWSGHTRGCSPGRFLLGSTGGLYVPACWDSRTNEQILTVPCFASVVPICLSLVMVQHTHTHTRRLSSGPKAHCHRDSHLVTLSPLSSAATLPKPRLTDGALGRPSVRCLGMLQLKRPAATQMHEHKLELAAPQPPARSIEVHRARRVDLTRTCLVVDCNTACRRLS